MSSVESPFDGPATDLRLRTRFNVLIQIAGLFLALAAIASFVLTVNATVLVLSLVCAGILVAAPHIERDIVRLFLLVHPSLMYVATAYFYAAVHLNLEFAGFIDLTLAVSIAFVYQTAICLAFVVTYSRAPVSRPLIYSARWAATTAIIAFLLYCIAVTGPIGALRGFAPALFGLMCVGLGAYVLQSTPRDQLVALVVSLVATLAVSVVVNERTSLFVLLLFCLVLFLAGTRKLITFSRMLLVLAFIILANWVTFAFLTARIEESQGLTANTVGRTVELAFSYEGVAAAIPLLPMAENPKSQPNRQRRYHAAFLRNSAWGEADELSVFARLTLLAHMDVVTGRLGDIHAVKWHEIAALVPNALPNVGQQKNLIYSDDVVWDLGLRDRNSIGRPMITVAGELYTMGGLAAVFWIALVVFTLIFLLLRLIRSGTGYNPVYVGAMLSLLYAITMTGTALGAVAMVLRTLPLMWIALVIVTPRSLATQRSVRSSLRTSSRRDRAPGTVEHPIRSS